VSKQSKRRGKRHFFPQEGVNIVEEQQLNLKWTSKP
jgi:hypothetical protein